MQINFTPMMTNNRLQQSKQNTHTQAPAFKAVNKEWLAKIIDDVDKAEYEFRFRLLNPKSGITKEDYVDTLIEAAKHYGEGFQDSFRSLIEWGKKYDRNDRNFS